MTPIVAIVGRPNVGKSTLFNRLVGQKLAIVHDLPGVTRDRHYSDAHVGGRNLTVVDTGGFDPTSDDPMQSGIARHVLTAIEEADVVVCVLDGTLPPTEPDRDAVQVLRRSGKPVVYVANKVDIREHEHNLGPLYELGLPSLIAVSALHGRGTAELGQAIGELLPPLAPEEPAGPDDAPRIALVGRPNAGKSSLFNRVVGEERSLVDNRPGTTRDPIDERVEFGGQEFVIVDTAGFGNRAAAVAMTSADAILIPTLSGEADVTEAEKTVRLAEGLARAARREIPTAVLLNKVRRTQLSRKSW